MNKTIPILFFVMVVLSSFVSAALIDNQKAYYKFDGDVTDETGNFNGTDQGTDNQPIGLINQARAFVSGNTDYVDTNIPTLQNQDFTIVVWINTSTSAYQGIVAEYDPESDNGFFLRTNVDGDDLVLGLADGTYATVTKVTTISDGDWHMVGFKYDWSETTAEIILDGNYTGTTLNKDYVANAVDVWVGAYNPAQNTFNGDIDEVGFWDRLLSAGELTTLYNGGAGLSYPFVPPPSVDTINISSPLPANDTGFFSLPILFNLTANSTFQFNASLIINGVVNQTTNFSSGTNVLANFSVASMPEGFNNYSFFVVQFNDSSQNETSITNTFLFDFQPPTITTNFANNSLHYNDNITGQFNFSDNLLLHTVNITLPLDNITLFNSTHIHNTTFQYNLSHDITGFSFGDHILSIFVSDGHTLEKLKDGEAWNPTNGIFNDYIKYRLESPYKEKTIKTYLKGGSIFDHWTTEEKIDRYTEIVTPYNPKSTQIIIVEADQKIEIIEDPTNKYGYGGSWLAIGEHWKDFKLKNEPDAIVQSITKISDYKIEATITGIKNIDILVFESIGDLNIVQQNYTFVVGNFTSGFEDPIFSNFPTTYNLTGIINLTGNISSITPVAFLEYNGTNLTTTLVSFNRTFVEFTRTLTPAEIENVTIITHRWYFNISGFTIGFLSTNETNQTLFNITVGQCTSPNLYPIVRFSYFNEITGAPIVATNAYDFAVSDGTFFYNQTGSFNGSNNNSICTNVNPTNATYNWDMWGTITSLSAPGFVSRVIDIEEIAPFQLSNNPTTNISLFLIDIPNSSTVKYNWLTTDFQVVDGTMRIFKCNVDGTKELVESIPVISSSATANIRLLVQPYSYDIIIDGTLFTNPDGFTQCHVESLTELTFYVDVTPIDIATLIGLNGIPCIINKTGNRTALLRWGNNPENLVDDLFGCFTAWRKTIGGQVEVFSNCTVEVDFEREVSVPSNGNEYIVQGHLLQNGEQAICGEVSFSPDDEAAGRFGISGLLGVFFLFVGVALIYAGQGQEQLLGGGIGIVAAWLLGILNFPWLAVSAMVAFLVIIALIGRYTRKVP